MSLGTQMLKKINKGRVESDAGFFIHITGLECLKYEDAAHSVDFEWNYDPKMNRTYVYISDLKNLSDIEKNEIKTNIQEAVKLLDGNFEVI